MLANDSDPDGDALTIILLSHPTHGKLTLRKDGSFVYQPDRNFVGTDTLTYQLRDSRGALSAAVKVRIVVGDSKKTGLSTSRQADLSSVFSSKKIEEDEWSAEPELLLS